MATLRAACLLLVGSMALPAAAPAQDVGDERASEASLADAEAARALFEQGVERLRTGAFAHARDLFRSSLEAYRTSATAFNLAVALRGTGELTESIAVLERMVAGEYGRVYADDRVAAEELASSLRTDTGRLHLRVVGPTDAELRIDGRPVREPPRAGAWSLPLDPGAHVLELRATGYAREERSVHVARGGEMVLRMELRPEGTSPGHLVLEGPADMRLQIVGVGSSRGRLSQVLDPGTYTVRMGSHTHVLAMVPDAQLTLRLEHDDSILSEPWFWVAAGAVAIAVGAGIWYALPAERDPYIPDGNPVDRAIETLLFP